MVDLRCFNGMRQYPLSHQKVRTQSCVLLLQRGNEALLGDAEEKNSSQCSEAE